MKKNIGQIIAEARESKGISQRKLARIANISNTEICRIESGDREIPRPKTLRKISRPIGVNYNELMYKIGLGLEINPLNPYIREYYSKLSLDELNIEELNILGYIFNLEQFLCYCNKRLNDKSANEQELLLYTIEDTEYLIDISKDTIELIQKRKLSLRNNGGNLLT
ncbi:MAG: helix-turn-helix transcriptional regulator [Bacilli bacterium]|nr:helix-turn-helix transcriptional regulator [Bacilli bacterium]